MKKQRKKWIKMWAKYTKILLERLEMLIGTFEEMEN